MPLDSVLNKVEPPLEPDAAEALASELEETYDRLLEIHFENISARLHHRKTPRSVPAALKTRTGMILFCAD